MTAVRRALVVYARPPIAGKVKTRLLTRLDAAEALALYEAMLADLIERVSGAQAGRAEVHLAWSEPCDPPGWLAGIAASIHIELQHGNDLGERMARTLQEKLGAGFGRVVLVGADAPHLPAEYLEQAFESLEKADLAIGPADDGGYYLIGARRLHPRIFRNVPWGTDRVMAITRARLREGGVAWHELPRWYDVDTPADVARLWNELRQMKGKGATDLPRRTFRVLASIVPGRL